MIKASAISIVISTVAFFLASPNTFCAGEVKQYQIQSKILSDGGEAAQRTLSVYLPEGYNTSGASYPVLYLIHGYTDNNLIFLGGSYRNYDFGSKVSVNVIVDRLIQEGKIKPLIVACPDVNRSWFTKWTANKGGAITPYDQYLLHDIVSFVDAKLRTIPNRESRAIAGHGLGGYDSIYMAITHPEAFSFAGGFSSNTLTAITASLDELLKDYDKTSYPMHFWLYAGTRDEWAVAQPNEEFVEALKQNGFPTEYAEDNGRYMDKLEQRLSEFIEFVSKFLKW